MGRMRWGEISIACPRRTVDAFTVIRCCRLGALIDDGPQPQLDYAPSLPWRRRKAMRRWLVLGLVVVCAIVWGPRLWNRVQVLWWQRQCLAYSAPANQ